MSYDKLKGMIKDAMVSKDTEKLSVLRMLKNKSDTIAKNDGNRSVTDADVLTAAIKTDVELRDLIKLLENNGKSAEKAQYELGVIADFLPSKMTDDELVNEISSVKNSYTGNPNGLFGAVMKHMAANHKGRYDTNRVKELLQG